MKKYPFCKGEIEFDFGDDHPEEHFKLMLAQLEILGVPYLDALKKQGFAFDEKTEERMRHLLRYRFAKMED